MPISQLLDFESELGLVLPDDFRRFIVEVGNGGAGPAYGLGAFNPQAKAFRHPAWRAPFVIPKQGEDDDGDDEPSGCIKLSDYGCGILDFLVVNGTERGNIWFSDDACHLYPLPGSGSDSLRHDLPTDRTSSLVWRQRLGAPANTSRISFVDSFEKWIDEVLADDKLAAPWLRFKIHHETNGQQGRPTLESAQVHAFGERGRPPPSRQCRRWSQTAGVGWRVFEPGWP